VNISIPVDLTAAKALAFCERIENVSEADNYNLCFEPFAEHGTVDPFGMLLASAKIRQFIDEKKAQEARILFQHYNLSEYASHMGFYRSCR
jgi:hypothetical protein